MNPETLQVLELLQFHAEDDADPRSGFQLFQHAMHDIAIEINKDTEPYHVPQLIHHAGQAYAKDKVRKAYAALVIALNG